MRALRGPHRPPWPSGFGVGMGGLTALLAGSCTSVSDATTTPASTEAAALNWLWWFSLALGLAVYTVVIVLLLVPLWRSRRRRSRSQEEERGSHGPDSTPQRPVDRSSRPGQQPLDTPPASVVDEPLPTANHELAEESDADRHVRGRLIWIGGILAPVVILIVLLIASSITARNVAHVEQDDELLIEVVGHMFWWEVRYPDSEVVTANEIRVPVDRPVRLRLTTEDVIHSFWIPALHGKIDMIPGTENWLSFEATETGRFRGQCAEFCGIAHAQMAAFIEVVDADAFDVWVASQRDEANEPAADSAVQGRNLFLERGCAACHTVQGTAAVGDVGPDLTHVASRRTIAAGQLPNNRENLAELILSPREVKPGIRMPPTVFDDDELDEVLDYLETLS